MRAAPFQDSASSWAPRLVQGERVNAVCTAPGEVESPGQDEGLMEI